MMKFSIILASMAVRELPKCPHLALSSKLDLATYYFRRVRKKPNSQSPSE